MNVHRTLHDRVRGFGIHQIEDRGSSAGSAALSRPANPARSRESSKTPHGKRSCCET
jgi:hypothetical protein